MLYDIFFRNSLTSATRTVLYICGIFSFIIILVELASRRTITVLIIDDLRKHYLGSAVSSGSALTAL